MLLILSLEQEGVYIVWKEEVINSKDCLCVNFYEIAYLR